MRRIVAALYLLTLPLAAQEQKKFNLVAATVPGRIEVPPGANWKPLLLDLYDDGGRPVFSFVDLATHMTVSLTLFPNKTGEPTAESCRKDVLDPLLKSEESSSVVTKKKLDTRVTPAGVSLAIGSYFINSMSNIGPSRLTNLPVQVENILGFLGSVHTCAEIHISKAAYTSADLPLFNAALDSFNFDGDYQPTLKDYSLLAAVYFRNAKNYFAAAVYYQRALDALPMAQSPDPSLRRYLTDQLSMSYGMAGDLNRSRAVNEHAIQIDPTYPLYYYNLACADAEQGNAADAHTHLQQAFDRKANTLPGEHLPDPATDHSIIKLKKNKEFWAYVQTLRSQTKP